MLAGLYEIRAGTRKRGPFPVWGSSVAHAQSPIWATDMHVLSEASSSSIVHVLCAGSPEPLLSAYMISTVF